MIGSTYWDQGGLMYELGMLKVKGLATVLLKTLQLFWPHDNSFNIWQCLIRQVALAQIISTIMNMGGSSQHAQEVTGIWRDVMGRHASLIRYLLPVLQSVLYCRKSNSRHCDIYKKHFIQHPYLIHVLVLHNHIFIYLF